MLYARINQLIPSDLNIVHEDSYARRLIVHVVDLITIS
jgi:hypothetical protein